MADMMEVSRLKNSKVLVEVVEALEDLLVVSFKYQERTGSTKHFQGVLLNSKKKNWPLGVMAPSIPFPGTDGDSTAASADAKSTMSCNDDCVVSSPSASGQLLPVALQDGDRLYAVRRRHTYFQGSANGGGMNCATAVAGNTGTMSPSIMMAANRRSTYSSRRFGDKTMRTMRLRPRQVLCSKCKSICNENSENVQVANAFKRTGSSTVTVNNTLIRSGGGGDVPQSCVEQQPRMAAADLIDNHERLTLGPSKLDGQQQQQCTAGGRGGGRMVLRKRRIQNDDGLPPPLTSPSPSLQSSAAEVITPPVSVADMDQRAPCTATVAKKSRELVQDDGRDNVTLKEDQVSTASAEQQQQQQSLKQKKTSPFIKISFGPQGTVIKIPPRTHTYIASDDNESDLQDSLVNPESGSSPAYRHFRAKAAKKALKKAKKDAQKIRCSPLRQDSLFDTHKSRHHKHKFKHKRKHREDGGCGDDDGRVGGEEVESSPEDDVQRTERHNGDSARAVVDDGPVVIDGWDLQSSTNGHNRSTDAYSKIKKECLRQKLSISLKRLSEKSYMKCSPTYNNNNIHLDQDSNSGGGSGGNGGSGGGGGSNNSSEAGDLPEFPEISEPPKDPTMRPLMMRISSYNVDSFSLADGRIVSVGDVVWGKIHGFPWWPGKVLSISVSQRDNGLLVTQQAHVAWFGSSTSSQMPCNQLVPFLEDFKLRYNKKKRGPYKEAIKQATLAASEVLRSVRVDTT